MDTKSKKRKRVISFAVFFVSVSLLLANGAVVLNRLLSMGDWKEYGISQLMEQDYQNTREFRRYIQGRLSDFIAMASGGKISTYFDINSDYWEEMSGVRISRYPDGNNDYNQDVILSEKPYEAADAEDSAQPDGSIATDAGKSVQPDGSTDPSDQDLKDREKKLQEQYEANAKAYHESIRENKNMLYSISNAGRQLYSNMDGINWDKSNQTLPEGYNFLMIFNQGKASIVKDGIELEIYGDGYYHGGAQWYVPGYKNFTFYPASDSAEGVSSSDSAVNDIEIIILAAQEPVSFSYVRYGQGGYQQAENRLYYIAEDVRSNYNAVRFGIIGLMAGALLFVVYLLLRKEKKAADEIIARFTGRVWVEVKCLMLLILSAWLGTAGYTLYYGDVQAVTGTAETYGTVREVEVVDFAASDRLSSVQSEETVFEGGSAWDLSEQVAQSGWNLPVFSFRSFVGAMADHTAGFLVSFWIVYLIINDMHKNKGHFWDGIIRKIWRSAKTDGLKQPFAVQQVRSYAFLACLSIAALLAVIILALLYSKRFLNMTELIFWSCLVLGMFLVIVSWRLAGAKKNAAQMDLLADYILAVQGGDFTPKEDLPKDSCLKHLFKSLHQIRQGMETAVAQQLKSERMKVELVANVSHDLKTPLTSIISYISFLKQEEGLPEHVMDYIRILDEKAGRLNVIVQDVFAVSKAASGQLPIEMEELDFGKLLRQTLADMQEQIQAAPVSIKADISAQEVRIVADGNRMYRVFQNLIQNALKYSLEGSRIFVDLKQDGEYAIASIKNISRKELNAGIDFTERFLRGDESRTDGGAGLGLSIAKSFTEACGGEFLLEVDADLFIVKVRFKYRNDNAA